MTSRATVSSMPQAEGADRHAVADRRRQEAVGDVHGGEIVEPAVRADAYALAVRAQGRESAEMTARADLGATDDGGVGGGIDVSGDARAEFEMA